MWSWLRTPIGWLGTPFRWLGRNAKLIGAFAGFLAGLATLVAVVATLFVTQESVMTAEKGLVTERFKNGVEDLGADDPSVQAGGVYTLERVAMDSSDDAETAFAVIMSFVRQHLCDTKIKDLPSGPPRSVVAGLEVLHRHTQPIKLQGLNCQGGTGIDLSDVNLSDAHLESAFFSGARLERANLTGANLTGATLDHADFTNGGYRTGGATLTDVVLKGAHVDCAGFSRATGLTRDQLRSAQWDPHQPPSVDRDKKNWVAPAVTRNDCKH